MPGDSPRVLPFHQVLGEAASSAIAALCDVASIILAALKLLGCGEG